MNLGFKSFATLSVLFTTALGVSLNSAQAALISASIDTDAFRTLNSVTLDQDGDTVADTTINAANLQLPTVTSLGPASGSGLDGAWLPNIEYDTTNPPPTGDASVYLEDRQLGTAFSSNGNSTVTVEFAGPIQNNEGAEIVFMEWGGNDSGQGNAGIPVTINSQAVRIFQSAPGTSGVPEFEWVNVGGNQTMRSWRVDDSTTDNNGAIDDLAELENIPAWTRLSQATLPFAGVALDLSDFGYASGAIVTDLEVEIGPSGGLDHAFIGAIPEPGSMALLGAGASLMAFRRRRKA